MFRHTRDTLREYYKRGMLERDVPTHDVQDNAINLEPTWEIPLYRAVSDYVRDFYRLAQKQERKALGFLMTLYRKRLTSSFYAVRQSLQRRLDGISVTDDDLIELDEVEDAVITGLEADLAEPVDPKEVEYLEDLLRQFENTGEDSKLSFLIDLLRQELLERENILIFTQYTDTMDYLRASFYYDGTVEAKVYRRLRDCIDLFQNVVGHIQPILAEVPTFIEKAVMSADPQEEDVLMAEFEQNVKAVQAEMDVDDLVTKDVDA